MIAWYDLPFSIVNDVIEYLASPEKWTESLWPLGLFSQYLTGGDVMVVWPLHQVLASLLFYEEYSGFQHAQVVTFPTHMTFI